MSKRLRHIVRFIVTLSLLFLGLLLQQMSWGKAQATVAYRLGSAVVGELDLVFGALHQVPAHFASVSALQKQVLGLELKVREQEAIISNLRQVEAQNQILRSAFASASAERKQWAVATLNPTLGKPTVDVGKQEGISNGASVLAQGSLIGIVTNAGDHYSEIRLVTDEGTRWAIKHGRSGKAGVLSVINGKAEVEFLERLDDIHTGDEIVTAGDNGVMPNLSLGTVSVIRTRISDAVTKVEVGLTAFPLVNDTVLVAVGGGI